VLLIPIGGQHTINATQAAEVISQVEPHIVIPMHYSPSIDDVPNPLDKFCREMGIEALNPQPKLSISRNALPTETQVVILSSRS
jgi:L-ascorbate metabolism protein UlaG (beta-lactamase superfamily)